MSQVDSVNSSIKINVDVVLVWFGWWQCFVFVIEVLKIENVCVGENEVNVVFSFENFVKV